MMDKYDGPDLTLVARAAYEAIRRDVDAGWLPQAGPAKQKPPRGEWISENCIRVQFSK